MPILPPLDAKTRRFVFVNRRSRRCTGRRAGLLRGTASAARSCRCPDPMCGRSRCSSSMNWAAASSREKVRRRRLRVPHGPGVAVLGEDVDVLRAEREVEGVDLGAARGLAAPTDRVEDSCLRRTLPPGSAAAGVPGGGRSGARCCRRPQAARAAGRDARRRTGDSCRRSTCRGIRRTWPMTRPRPPRSRTLRT